MHTLLSTSIFHSWGPVCSGRETSRVRDLRTYVDMTHPVPLKYHSSCGIGQVIITGFCTRSNKCARKAAKRKSKGAAVKDDLQAISMLQAQKVHGEYLCTCLPTAINPGAVYVVQSTPCLCPHESTCLMLIAITAYLFPVSAPACRQTLPLCLCVWGPEP